MDQEVGGSSPPSCTKQPYIRAAISACFVRHLSCIVKGITAEPRRVCPRCGLKGRAEIARSDPRNSLPTPHTPVQLDRLCCLPGRISSIRLGISSLQSANSQRRQKCTGILARNLIMHEQLLDSCFSQTSCAIYCGRSGGGSISQHK